MTSTATGIIMAGVTVCILTVAMSTRWQPKEPVAINPAIEKPQEGYVEVMRMEQYCAVHGSALRQCSPFLTECEAVAHPDGECRKLLTVKPELEAVTVGEWGMIPREVNEDLLEQLIGDGL